MKTYKIKDLIKGLNAGTSLLFDSFLNSYYPEISGNESNFLTDYASAHAYFDKAFGVKYGNRQIDLESDTLSDAISEFRSIMSGVTLINLNNWARLYYALSIDYNPLFNVDGLTTRTYGATENTDSYGIDKTTLNYASREDTTQYGATQDTTQYGATQDTTQYGATEDTTQYGATKSTTDYGATSETKGAQTNTDTSYSVSYDSATEKETGKVSHSIGAQTNTSLLHTDETSTIQHSDVASSIQHSDITSSLMHSDVASSIQHSDISSSIQHTDTLTQGAHIDTNTRDAHIDKHSTIQHIDTELRQGNIGVTKSTELLDAETIYRTKSSFWSNVFKSLCNEGGVYYDYYAL